MNKIFFRVLIFSFLVFPKITFAQTGTLTLNDVTIPPIFPGGESKLNQFVAANFVSPEIEGANGLIKISFVVEIDGSLTNIKIIQNLGNEFAQAAKNVFIKSPKWLPGELNGEKVRVLMNYPINIR